MGVRHCCYFGLWWLLSASASASSLDTSVTSFDNIHLWVGVGANRAAIVIDWQHDSADDEALVWGYRWDGVATGEDMLLAIVQADSRLFLRHGTNGDFGLPIYGIGYDENNDGQFGITTNIPFSPDGFAETSVPDQPPMVPGQSVQESDHYAEGYFRGFWHYTTNVGNPFEEGSWMSSAEGLSSRELANGSWDGWTFESPASLMPTSFPENPLPAAAPTTADFDLDGDVDGADFLRWQRDFHESTSTNDLLLWQPTYGCTEVLATSHSIPEPSSLAILFTSLMLLGGGWKQRHRTTRNCT